MNSVIGLTEGRDVNNIPAASIAAASHQVYEWKRGGGEKTLFSFTGGSSDQEISLKIAYISMEASESEVVLNSPLPQKILLLTGTYFYLHFLQIGEWNKIQAYQADLKEQFLQYVAPLFVIVPRQTWLICLTDEMKLTSLWALSPEINEIGVLGLHGVCLWREPNEKGQTGQNGSKSHSIQTTLSPNYRVSFF